jgi:hypothetical protein
LPIGSRPARIVEEVFQVHWAKWARNTVLGAAATASRLEESMADAIRRKVIRADVVSAYSHCPRKAFLLHCTEERGTPHEYQVILEEHTNVRRTSYLAALQKTSASIRSYKDGTISSGIDVLTEANLKAADLDGYCDVLTKVSGTRHENPSNYEPTIVVGTQRIEKDQLFHLSFTGLVLGQIQGRPPAMGYLVTAGGERHRANLQPTYKIVGSKLVRRLTCATTRCDPQQALSVLPVQEHMYEAS